VIGVIAFALLGLGIKGPSGASTASTRHRSRPVNLLAGRLQPHRLYSRARCHAT